MGNSQSSEERREALFNELDKIDRQMWELLSPGWKVDLGPIAIRRRIGSQAFAKLFVLFNVVLGSSGAVMIFVGKSAADFGIALVVGAAFSLGSFIAQVWSHTVESERAANRVEMKESLEALMERRKAALTELMAIQEPGSFQL